MFEAQCTRHHPQNKTPATCFPYKIASALGKMQNEVVCCIEYSMFELNVCVCVLIVSVCRMERTKLPSGPIRQPVSGIRFHSCSTQPSSSDLYRITGELLSSAQWCSCPHHHPLWRDYLHKSFCFPHHHSIVAIRVITCSPVAELVKQWEIFHRETPLPIDPMTLWRAKSTVLCCAFYQNSNLRSPIAISPLIHFEFVQLVAYTDSMAI